MVIGTVCIGSCKSNYHTITATTALILELVLQFEANKCLNTIDPFLVLEIVHVNIEMKTATGDISSFPGQAEVDLKLG